MYSYVHMEQHSKETSTYNYVQIFTQKDGP